MNNIRFSSPVIEQLEFKKNKDNNGCGTETTLAVEIQKSDVLKIDENDYYFCINIIISGEDAPFKISLQISCVFNLENNDAKANERFIIEKGTQILTSYARPVIADLVLKAGFPPLVIPYYEK